MNIKKGVALILALVLIVAFSTVAFANEDEQYIGEVNWKNGYVEVYGFGYPPSNSVSSGHGNILARRAAIVDAYRNLAELVNGIRVDSEDTVQNMMVKDSYVQTKVSALIKGAAIVGERPLGDGSYRVTMRLSIYGDKNNSLAGTIYGNYQPTPFPTPTTVPQKQDTGYSVVPNSPITNPQSNTQQTEQPKVYSAAYTGVVIDCSGLGLERVMSPVIVDTNGRAIYGYKNLSPDYIAKYGMADYISKDNYDISRAGSNPLAIKATSIAGNNANPVITVQDADRLLAENEKGRFLDNAAVVFVQ